MFKPHVTVACVVHTQGKFLIVEETINNEKRWNQPAGHLEADETLIQAAERELWEETGIRATPQHFFTDAPMAGTGQYPLFTFRFCH